MPFIRRYRGGIYPTGKLPPCVLFCFIFLFCFPHDHQRPSQTTETVHNCFSGPSLDRRNVLCGERAVLHRFLRFSRALSLESSLSAHSCRLIKRKSTTSCLGRSFDHRFHSRKRLAAPRAQRARAHARVLARIISRTRSLSSSAFSARWSSFFCSGSASSSSSASE